MTQKRCSGSCGRMLEVNEVNFQKNRSSKDGHQSCCRDCQNEYARDYARRMRGFKAESKELETKFRSNKIKETTYVKRMTALREKWEIKGRGRRATR